jgi:uncharacterized protein YuzE
MNVTTVVFKRAAVAESDEGKNVVIIDYDEGGDLVGLEILDASKKIRYYATVQFKVV